MVYSRATALGFVLGSTLSDAFIAPAPAKATWGPSSGRARGQCPTQSSRPVRGAADVASSTAAKISLRDIFDLVTGTEDLVTLPQDPDSNTEAREEELAKKKEDYVWYYGGPPEGAPYLEGQPPDEEKPSIVWILKTAKALADTILGVARGTIGIGEIVEALSNPTELKAFVARVKEILNNTDRDERPTSLEDYNDLLSYPIKTPLSVYDWDDDEAYARRRLQGANPIAIQKCTEAQRAKLKILDTDSSYAEMKNKVDDLLAAGKLFVVDHEMLHGMEADPLNGEIDRYLATGIALFEKVDDTMLPIRALGIQLTQGETPVPIFTPDDPEYTWNIAKACFEAADQLCHEVVSHLSYTHVVLEIPLVAMNRCLASSHPLNKLLRPHLEGTAYINWGAQDLLIQEDSSVDNIYANKIEDCWTLALEKVVDRIKGDFSPPVDFAARGVTEEDLEGNYLYRDIGLKYWEAIYTWVDQYLAIYYTSEVDFIEDYELQAFVEEMVNAGSFLWLSEFEGSNDKRGLITKVFATLIHTASVLHAAVNFPQATSTNYVPSSPGSVYVALPTDKSARTEQQFLDYLPPMEIASEQVTVLTLLGSVYYTELGEYGSHFTDDRVRGPLAQFQDAIEDIGSDLDDLNVEIVKYWRTKKEPKVAKNFAYKTLVPEKIPQSINI